MNRRNFIAGNTGMFLGGICTSGALSPALAANNGKPDRQKKPGIETGELEYGIDTLPNFCAHEHWGSIAAIGSAPDQNGYRADTTAGARPTRPVSIWDLIMDPYAGSWMKLAKRDPNEAAIAAGHRSQQEWWDKDPARALKKFASLVHPLMLTGGFQCTRRGIKYLYDTDIARFSTDDWLKADRLIQTRYSDIFSWYKSAMDKARFSALIRPVHPEFYVQRQTKSSAEEEAAFTNTVMRIDPLLDLWKAKDPRCDALSAIVGIEPADAASFREFIKRIFELAQQHHAVGIKQMEAYRRSFRFLERSDADVVFRGDLNPSEILAFQDWVMHECCKQAHERQWTHQVHVGTHNLGESNPLPLEELSKKYTKMKIVMIHCWPFIKEAGWLAKMRPNMYLDSNWLAVLNPAFLAEALQTWLGYVPAHKIMLSHDSTHIEMATGSSLFAREALSAALINQNKTLDLPKEILKRTAADLLHNNAVRLYGIGKEVYL